MEVRSRWSVACLLWTLAKLVLGTSQSSIEGCRSDDGVRLSEKVYGCRGEWIGHVSNADSICSSGYHVCRWDDDQSVRQLHATHVIPYTFPNGDIDNDCFAYNAAQNDDGCGPCHGERGVSDEMAGIGRQCHFENYHSVRNRSCLFSGKVSHDQGMRPNQAVGCTFLRDHTTGVVCCKTDPQGFTSPSPEPEIPTTSGRVSVEITDDNNILPFYGVEVRTPDDFINESPNSNAADEESGVFSDGCQARNRSGLFHLKDVAACSGEWQGHVRTAGTLCAPGWKVCSHQETSALGRIDFAYSKRHGIPGCFAVNAAHSREAPCRECVEGSSNAMQMAGVGRDCYRDRVNGRKERRHDMSCFGRGRVDATSFQPGRECSYDLSLSGVICCRQAPPACRKGCVQGVCVTSDNGESRCQCHPGWKGSACHRPICRQKCRHGGKCIAPETCKCRSGYGGRFCKPLVKPCQDGCIHGTCNTTASRRGMCQCASGWTGPACNQAVCQRPCKHGTCVKPNVCLCNKGWKGSSCRKAICKDGCVNGKCLAPGKCKCRKGWKGRRCRSPICEMGCPSTRGFCKAPNFCQCFRKFYGDSCERRVAHPPSNNNHSR